MRISDWSSDLCSSDLTSITSYSDYKRNSRAADDGTAVQDYDYVANDGYIRDFNQELRLSNDAASRMRVTVGANYQHSKVYELSKLSNGDSIVSNFSQIDGTRTLLPVPFSRVSDFSRQPIEIGSASRRERVCQYV